MASTDASAPAGSSGTPNFWSSCAVEMNSWPPAWMPAVTRSMTRARLPSRRAMAAMRAGSSGESTTILAKPCSMASAISSSDLLLPCSTRRRPGAPAASAMRISPIEQVSTSMPASVTIRTTSLDRNALPAKLTCVVVLWNASAAARTNRRARAATSSVSMRYSGEPNSSSRLDAVRPWKVSSPLASSAVASGQIGVIAISSPTHVTLRPYADIGWWYRRTCRICDCAARGSVSVGRRIAIVTSARVPRRPAGPGRRR